MTKTPAMPERIWTCQIGGHGELPQGADGPMRDAIASAFKAVTGSDAAYCFSGWGSPLPERYRAVVENRLPDPDAIRRECFAVLDTLPDAVTAPGGDFAALQSAQPAEVVSDESAYNLIDRFLRNNLHDDDYAEYSQALDILALRPQAVPMTDEQIEAIPVWARFVGLWPETRKDIVRAIEAHHGITQRADGGEKQA